MTNAPVFSVVIPSYNRAKILPETILSLTKQTFADWECIVVDDGSADNTQSVVEALTIADTRVKYVYQQNAERSTARNNGVNHSVGKYVCFLDSDDSYEPTYLEQLFLFLQQREFPVALTVARFKTRTGVHETVHPVPPITEEPAIWLLKNPVSPTRACVHRDILNKYRFREDICIVEDSVLWVSISNEFPVLLFEEPLVIYNIHEDNSVAPTKNSAAIRLAGLKLFFKEPESRIIPNRLKKDLLSDCYYKIAVFYSYKKQFFDMLKNLFISWWLSPLHPHTNAKFFMLVEYFSLTKNLWRGIKKHSWL